MIRLFKAGATPSSVAAEQTVTGLLQRPEFAGRYRLEVIDVLQQPRAAVRAGLVATPTVLLQADGRTVRFVGELDDERLAQFLRTPGG